MLCPASEYVSRKGFEVRRSSLHQLRFVATQVAVWAGLYGLYLFVRSLVIDQADDALAHATQLIHLEGAVGLLHEASFQSAIASVKGLGAFFDLYYMLGFGPLLVLALVWLAWRRRTSYRELRSAMLVSLALASVFFVFYPTAPPRLVEGMGVVDTVGLAGHDAGSFAGIHFDPYAAMPSMHVGWSLLLALVGLRAIRRPPLRALLVVHPVLMTLAVTATGNHFFVDAVAGSVVALLGYSLISCTVLRHLPAPRRVRTPRLGSGRCPVHEST